MTYAGIAAVVNKNKLEENISRNFQTMVRMGSILDGFKRKVPFRMLLSQRRSKQLCWVLSDNSSRIDSRGETRGRLSVSTSCAVAPCPYTSDFNFLAS